jgi:hypothetical protein
MKYLLTRHPMFSLLAAGLIAGAVLLLREPSVRSDKQNAPDPVAVERARTTVKMLDDVHKGYVVHITATYVKAQVSTPAATVAKKVFKHMDGKGWGKVRLVDATGEPLNEANLPRTEFEKRAVAKLKSGKDYYEEIGTRDGKPVLRAATKVPVVMSQCLACHADKKEGDLLGSLVYEVPIK